jgi:hypothetical protein
VCRNVMVVWEKLFLIQLLFEYVCFLIFGFEKKSIGVEKSKNCLKRVDPQKY